MNKVNKVEFEDEYDLEDYKNKVEDTQWTSFGNGIFSLAKPTIKTLPAGLYKVMGQIGDLYFMKQNLSVEGVFETGSMNAKEIINDCDRFWDMKEHFKKYGIPHRRGILMSGVPGSGKTCLIKLLANTIIEKRRGIILDCRESLWFIAKAIQDIRKIHPNVPVMVVMEDLDHYDNNISELLNVMDGLGVIDSVLFIATTNSVGTLDQALTNRPGRFDVHYKLMAASDKVREMFLVGLLPDDDKKKINIKAWVKDTKDMPFGHIRELVISVMVFGKDYKTTLKRLRNMTAGQDETDEDIMEN